MPRTRTSPDTRPLLSLDQVAAQILVEKSTLYSWACNGKTKNPGLTFTRIGGRLRVHPKDLESFLAKARES